MKKIKKGSPEYKKLSRELRILVKDIQKIFNYTRLQVKNWYNTNNIAFKGKKPIILFMEGKGKIVKDYIKKLKDKK